MNRFGRVVRAILYFVLSLLALVLGIASFTSAVYGSISSIFQPSSSKLIYGPPTAISAGSPPPPVPSPPASSTAPATPPASGPR